MATEKQSLLVKILDGAIEAVKRPFVIKRVTRAFDSAADSLEEQLLSIQAQQTSARESLVQAAKDGSNLNSYIQNLIDLQTKLTSIKEAQNALKEEKKELLD